MVKTSDVDLDFNPKSLIWFVIIIIIAIGVIGYLLSGKYDKTTERYDRFDTLLKSNYSRICYKGMGEYCISDNMTLRQIRGIYQSYDKYVYTRAATGAVLGYVCDGDNQDFVEWVQ